MDSHERRKPQSLKELIGDKPQERFPAHKRISLILEVLRGDISAEDLSRREALPLPEFWDWYHAFVGAGKNRVREITYKNPPVDGQFKIEVPLSKPYLEEIQLSMRHDFYSSLTDMIEHALFLQKHWLIKGSFELEEAHRKYQERVEKGLVEPTEDGSLEEDDLLIW